MILSINDIRHSQITNIYSLYANVYIDKLNGKAYNLTMKKKRKQVQCRVHGRNIYFYGKAARLIRRAIEVSGLTPEQFLHQALQNHLAVVRFQKDFEKNYDKQRYYQPKSR